MIKMRVIATALTCSVVLQTTGLPNTYAASWLNVNQGRTLVSNSTNTNATNLKLGSLEVELELLLPVNYTNVTDITGVLASADGTSYELEFLYDASSNKVIGTAKDCNAGEYTLTVTGTGYETFTQKVTIEAQSISKLYLKNSHELDGLYTKGSARPGVISYGDVTGDHKVTEEDMTAILDAITEGSTDSVYDLNKDGLVDILDASYISYNKGQESIESTQSVVLSPDSIANIETTASVIGKVSDIFTGEAPVQLAPENDKEISEDNPVKLSFDVDSQGALTEAITIAAPTEKDNAITEGIITVFDESGQKYQAIIGNAARTTRNSSSAIQAIATIAEDGSITINLNQQIAIKKVSITVTATNSRNLVEIAKVEFLNDMESKIPEPEMSKPTITSHVGGNKEFTISWTKESNITGYEVEVSADGTTEVLKAGTNRITVKQFNGSKIKNGTEFVIRVRAINGNWKGAYSDSVIVIPKATGIPDAPENIKIEGDYKLLNISWKSMDDTDSYNLYYRESGSSKDYTEITGITKNSYQLTGLKINTSYDVYLQGVNEIGVSKRSADSIGTTTALEHAKTSNFKLINVPEEDGKTAHIKSVQYPSGTTDSEFAVVDNDYATDWVLNHWNSGGYSGSQNGPIVTLDDYYTMDRIILVESTEQTYDYFYSKLQYWDENGKAHTLPWMHSVKRDSEGKRYYEFVLNEPITTNKVQISFANYLAYGDGMISIAEIKFYEYDPLEGDIYSLFEDDTHVSLHDWVTIDHITELEERLNVVDEVSGEYHYKKDILTIELENAKSLLSEQALRAAYTVDTTISKKNDTHLGFQSGLSALQPLGITAHQGEELIIYVGKEGANVGASTSVKLVATQYHAEYGTWYKEVVSDLKVGRNEVLIPKISSMAVEHGGALYVEYTDNNTSSEISIRVNGGTDYPVLDLSRIESEDKKKEAIRSYVTSLTDFVAGLEDMHNQNHKNNPDTNCDYDYDNKNCIYNVTDIVLDKMMYSVSAEQVLNGIISKAGNALDAQVETVYDSLAAMDQMMELFYQHKGLVEYPTDTDAYNEFVKLYGTANKMPTTRQNIRYQRMFAGAFMYAGGLHIGIEWDSIPGLMSGEPITTTDGKYEAGQFFGWGIAHEVGHIIDQNEYEVTEVTNNYFSVLAQATESNDAVRFNYQDVYDKVTSGTVGSSDNVFTNLGLYWQLHLAYDNGYNYKVYDSYEEQLENLIMARIDAYARNTSLAPAFADGKVFTLSGANKDNAFMRLACAATEKDLLDFFIAWGMVPDETTIEYASQFEKETRKIQYVNDEARLYRIENVAQADTIADTTSAAEVTATLSNEQNSNQVTLNFGVTGMEENSLLGYEILRNGKVIGFVEGSQTEFVDTVTFNNKVATYSVVAYDKFLNPTKECVLDSIKIKHDGSISKDAFSISTNMVSEQDEHEQDDVCGVHPIQAITQAINNDYNDVYVGSVTSGNAEIVLNLGEVANITGIKYTKGGDNAIQNYEIQVSLDGESWTSVKTGVFDGDTTQETVYFTNSESAFGARIDLQEASYVKLIATGQSTVSISELDVIGEPDDNVELIESGIGKLAKEFTVDEANGTTIPAGSVVFTGEYSGHPAFNVVLLVDADTDQVIAGDQYIFAQDPEDAELGNVSSGTWLYVIEPDEEGNLPELPKNVKAELYRVDDAIQLTGQRFVSDTLSVKVPEVLQDITLDN
ncbi:fibronectin type III domain-containing protein [Anaerosporobacter sp.]